MSSIDMKISVATLFFFLCSLLLFDGGLAARQLESFGDESTTVYQPNWLWRPTPYWYWQPQPTPAAPTPPTPAAPATPATPTAPATPDVRIRHLPPWLRQLVQPTPATPSTPATPATPATPTTPPATPTVPFLPPWLRPLVPATPATPTTPTTPATPATPTTPPAWGRPWPTPDQRQRCVSQSARVDLCVVDLGVAFLFQDPNRVSQECCAALVSLDDDCYGNIVAGFTNALFAPTLKDACARRTQPQN